MHEVREIFVCFFISNLGSVQESGEVANWRGSGTFWAQEVVVEVGRPGPPSHESSGAERREMVGGSEGERGMDPRGAWRVPHGDGVNCR